MNKLTDIYLTKWPGFIVKGEPVTLEQADEIILRTNSWFLCTNNYYYINQVARALGFHSDKPPRYPSEELIDYNKKRKFEESIQVLNLDCLATERIVSSRINGPHGWCNYDGTIFSNNGNIGKYPSAEEVFQEWQTVATIFPYLDLTCQLLSHEITQDEAQPVIEFRVCKGNVTYCTTNLELIAVKNPMPMPTIFTSEKEISISVEDLITKVNTLKAKLKQPNYLS